MLTRLAPSPTGAFHLGNARTFLINYVMARQSGWRILLRVEDLDGPRIKAGADRAGIEDLQWLGIEWDEGPVYQAWRNAEYRAAAERLVAEGRAYPCICSRREVEVAASAPHAEDGAAVYPGTCRGRFKSIEAARRETGRPPAVRFEVSAGEVSFKDQFAGWVAYEPARQLGDFVILKADGTAAYQLAVVLDDAGAGVTHIVRGDDLLDSTPRQILLYRALGLAEKLPEYCHLPLVVGTDGRRLAKRHGDTRVSHYRETGVSSGRMLALLARWSGLDCGEEATMADMVERFELRHVPREPVVMTQSDAQWLKRPKK